MGLVSVALIQPRVDDPETPYDETDTSANLAIPVVVGMNVTIPSEKLGAIPREQRQLRKPGVTTHESVLKPGMRDSHSLLSLLCTFLC